jgi:hypothetical protein
MTWRKGLQANRNKTKKLHRTGTIKKQLQGNNPKQISKKLQGMKTKEARNFF